MAGRIRSIKPELLDDERTCALTDAAWRLFVSLFLLADDHGNARAGARYLAANVWQDTGRAESTNHLGVSRSMDALEEAGLVRSYEINGQSYVNITGWAKHQRIDNAGKPRVPGPPEVDRADIRESRRVAASRGEPPLDPDPDHRPPTTDQGGSLRSSTKSPPFLLRDEVSDAQHIWHRYKELREAIGERYHPGNAPQFTATRRKQISARLKEFGYDKLLGAVESFLAPGSWWIENARVMPEYVFRSTKQVELHLEPKPQPETGPDVVTEITINSGTLPARRETSNDHESQNSGTATTA